jgi:tetratricopeptide (TPR) repeat protein
MKCSKYGRECESILHDEYLIFAVMPFSKDFDNVYDALQTAVKEILDKNYNCTRADDPKNFTAHSIWCESICKPIRKAKYIIVDITGRNANVFYELGIIHALENVRAIIITQNINDAPFDIKDLGLIEYTNDKLKDLRIKVQNAIIMLDKKDDTEINHEIPYDKIIIDLYCRLEELKKCNEKTEVELKEKIEHIKKLEVAQNQPQEEAEKTIFELNKQIAGLETKLKFAEKKNEETIYLKQELNKKVQYVEELEQKLNANKSFELSEFLSIELNNAYEARKYRRRAADLWYSHKYDEAIYYYDKAMSISTPDSSDYNARGQVYAEKGYYEMAISDLEKAIKMGMEEKNIKIEAYAKNGLGLAYGGLGKYEKSAEQFNLSIKLCPDNAWVYFNRGRVHEMEKDIKSAITDFKLSLQKNKPPLNEAKRIYAEDFIANNR